MLQWHQILMTFEQSIPDSITLLCGLTKITLVPFESLGDALQHRIFKNKHLVAKHTA